MTAYYLAIKEKRKLLNVLIGNKPQGLLLSKQSKLKMASRICSHKCKNKIIYCIHLYLYAPPGKIYKRLVAIVVSREKWVGYKVRTETSLSLYALYCLNFIIYVYITDSKNNIYTYTHMYRYTHTYMHTNRNQVLTVAKDGF